MDHSRNPRGGRSGGNSGYENDVSAQLCRAAQNGDMNCLRNMLMTNPRILRQFIVSPIRGHETPLHVAVEEGHVNFTRRLLQECADLSYCPVGPGYLPIHLAVANGRVEVVKLLLAYGHPEECYRRDDHGRLPIHIAAINGHDRILRELLNHSHSECTGRLTSEDHCHRLLGETLEGDNALHLCLKHSNNVDAVKVLVDFAISKNDKGFLLSRSQDGFNVMQLAVTLKRNKVVRYLLNPRILGEDGVRILNEGGSPPEGCLKQFFPTQDFRSKDIENLLQNAGFQSSTVQDDERRGKRGVWYRCTLFRTFDYGQGWLRDNGPQMLTMGQVILQSIVQVITWLDGKRGDESTINLRNRLSDSACICGGISLIATLIVLVLGKNLATNKFWGIVFVISMFAVLASFGYAFLEMIYLTSFSENKLSDRSWEADIVFEVLVGVAALLLFAGGLRLLRFCMERRRPRNV